MLTAVVGSILPILPGLPLAWVGLFIYAITTSFEKISVVTIVVFFIIMLLTLAVGYFAPILGARKQKASKWGVFGSFLGELIARKPPDIALRSAFGTFLGYITGTLLQIVVILIMAGFFLAALF